MENPQDLSYVYLLYAPIRYFTLKKINLILKKFNYNTNCL